MAQLTQSAFDRDLAIKNLKKSRLSYKAWFDKSKRLCPQTAIISQNDLVLLHITKLDNPYTDKLADKWGSPYRVHKILDGGACVLAELDGAKLDVVYAGNRLKKYWLRSTQKEVEKEPDEPEEPDKPNEPEKPDKPREPDEPDKPEEDVRKKWPLLGCGFFVQIP